MKNIAALDLHYLVEEFQLLVGSKLDKVYQPNKREFLFQFHISNKGNMLLRVLLPSFIYLTEVKEEQKEPMPFSMFLRKRLGNSRLKKIKQVGFERILEMHFETKEGILILIVELFSKGNLILCKSDYTIISPLEFQKWASREVKPKVKYQLPEQKTNLLELKEKELFDLIKKTEKNKLVTFLAIDLALGGEYSEKICTGLKIDKNITPKNLNETEIKKIFDEIGGLINKKVKLNEILNRELTKGLVEKRQTTQKSKYQNEIDRIQRIIDEQNQTIGKFKQEIEENTKKAELIYANYKLISEILTELNKAKEKYSWQEIKDKLKGHKLIKEINLKDKTVLVEIKV